MKARFPKKTWWWLVVPGLVALLGWPAVQRNNDIKAIENAIDRDWEISFDRMGVRSSMLPAFVASAAKAWFDWRYAGSGGYDGTQPVKTRNRGEVYYQRFQCLFRGPIEIISIGYPEKFRGDDLGAALARFPRLRFFAVEESDDPGPSEADWTLLCQWLRRLPQIEEIELGGASLTDAALAPLAGHPGLRTVTIFQGNLSPACAQTFAAMPQLAKLHIEGQRYDGDTWLTPEQERAMQAALPRVVIEAP